MIIIPSKKLINIIQYLLDGFLLDIELLIIYVRVKLQFLMKSF